MVWLKRESLIKSGARFCLIIYTFAAITACHWAGESRPSSEPRGTDPAARVDGGALSEIEFRTRTIRLGEHSLTVEVADDDQKRQRGLMFRDFLEEGRGMLFIFEREETLSFWMKNTYIPLSIGFFDRNRKLVDIQDMNPPRNPKDPFPPSHRSRHPALYALEVPQGWFQKMGVPLGTTFEWN